MIEKSCEECGKQFLTTKESRKFCSHPCYSKSRNTQTQKLCVECGKRFNVTNSNKEMAKYCSKKCCGKHRTTKISLICDVCKKSYKKQLTRAKDSKYCSKECRRVAVGKIVMGDITGKKFHKLLVVGFSHTHPKHKTSYWKCRCDCGTELIVRRTSLRQGRKNGRIQCDNCSPRVIDKYSIIRYQYLATKKSAAKRQLEHSISLEYLYNILIKQNKKCAISGIPLILRKTSSYRGSTSGRRPNVASVDRIDSSKGYIEGNVQWVTAQVNFAKSDFTTESVIEMAYFIVKQDKKNKRIKDV